MVRAWAKTEEMWPVYWQLLDNIKIEFDKQGIEIPFNTLDVNIKND
jgi:small conductance mechanosensitive channel